MTNPARQLYRALGQVVPLQLRRRLLYAKAHHRWPRLADPQSFTEKVNWRILQDRRELLSWTCDKLAMKEYAGRLAPSLRVPRTLWEGIDLDDLAGRELPERWVLKPNHRSKAVHIGSGPVTRADLDRITKGWMSGLQADLLGEWAYGKARKVYLCEEFIGREDGPPPDYKFFVFHGSVVLVQVDRDRFGAHQRRLYTPGWEAIEVRDNFAVAPLEEPPGRLADMLAVAGLLGAEFDFLRVDLYSVDGEIFFGETTPYPAGGLTAYVPRSFDMALGACWRLP